MIEAKRKECNDRYKIWNVVSKIKDTYDTRSGNECTAGRVKKRVISFRTEAKLRVGTSNEPIK